MLRRTLLRKDVINNRVPSLEDRLNFGFEDAPPNRKKRLFVKSSRWLTQARLNKKLLTSRFSGYAAKWKKAKWVTQTRGNTFHSIRLFSFNA